VSSSAYVNHVQVCLWK